MYPDNKLFNIQLVVLAAGNAVCVRSSFFVHLNCNLLLTAGAKFCCIRSRMRLLLDYVDTAVSDDNWP